MDVGGTKHQLHFANGFLFTSYLHCISGLLPCSRRRCHSGVKNLPTNLSWSSFLAKLARIWMQERADSSVKRFNVSQKRESSIGVSVVGFVCAWSCTSWIGCLEWIAEVLLLKLSVRSPRSIAAAITWSQSKKWIPSCVPVWVAPSLGT